MVETGLYRRRSLLFLIIGIGVVLTVYRDSFLSMQAIWSRSDTYAHGYFILPISLYLIYRQRLKIQGLPVRPNLWALPLLAACGFAWALANAADVLVVKQLAVVAMLPLLVLLLLGWKVFRALLFPLGFLFLAVPFGEALIPLFIEQTARFVIAALKLTGIPVYAEGNRISLPNGNWSVVEACSGLRYLLATLTLSLLFAYLSFTSNWRRWAFVVFSLAVAILANWVRAFGIVMIGYLSGMKLAVGIDHVIYGWVFFGLIIFIVFWVGGRWRQESYNSDSPTLAGSPIPEPVPGWPTAGVCLAGLLIIAIWPWLGRAGELPAPGRVELTKPVAVADWSAGERRLTEWRPEYRAANAVLDVTYQDETAPVGLYIAYYWRQRQGAELINSQNSLVSFKDNRWKQTGHSSRLATVRDRRFRVDEVRIHADDQTLLAWRWYWIGGHYTASPYMAKLWEALAKIFDLDARAAVIVIYTPYNEQTDPARARLSRFLLAMGPSLNHTLEQAKKGTLPFIE